MALSKKQKQYIRKYGERDTTDTMARALGVDKQLVDTYLHHRTSGAPKTSTDQSRSQLAFIEQATPLQICVTLALLAAAVAAYCFDARLYISGDNVEFIRFAEQLREGSFKLGNGKYPFAFASVLAVVQWLSDNSLVAQKIAVLVCYVATVPLTYFLVRRYVGSLWGVVAAFLFLSSPLALEFSHYVMSEIPYVTASVLALVVLQKSIDSPDSKRWFLAAAVAVILAYYVRTAGMALMAGVMAYYLFERQWKRLGIATGLFIGGMVPLWITNKLAGGQGYFEQIILKNSYRPELGTMKLPDFLQRLQSNLSIYSLQDFPLMAFPWRFETTMNHCAIYAAPVAISLSILLLALVVFAYWRGLRLPVWYTLAFGGILLLWPEYWSGERFAIPLLPIMALLLVFGAAEAARWGQRKFGLNTGRTIAFLGAAILLIMYGRNILVYHGIMENYPPAWTEYYKAAEWARDNTPADAVFVDRKGTLFGYTSKRSVVWIPQTQDTKAVLTSMYEQKADYVVLSSIPYSAIRVYLLPVVNKYSEWFTVVYKQENPTTYILKLNRDKALPQ
jgi:4-amino-4-deoxy-L-arabinose transferase-like glycosyltransferase